MLPGSRGCRARSTAPSISTGNFEPSAIAEITRFPEIFSFDVHLPVCVPRRKRSRVTSSDRRSDSSNFGNGLGVPQRVSISRAQSRRLHLREREHFRNKSLELRNPPAASECRTGLPNPTRFGRAEVGTVTCLSPGRIAPANGQGFGMDHRRRNCFGAGGTEEYAPKAEATYHSRDGSGERNRESV